MTGVEMMTDMKRMTDVKKLTEVEWMIEERTMEVDRMVVMGQGAFQHRRTALACSQSMLHIHLLCASCFLFLQVDSAQAC